MSEEDDPLALDGNWHRLCTSGDPSAMEQWGPNLKVSIAAVTQQGATLAHHEVGALIDTVSRHAWHRRWKVAYGESAACRTFMVSLKVRRRSEA
jgi:hypothetical protein